MQSRPTTLVAPKSLTIAILEDDKATRDLYQMLFEHHGGQPRLFRESDACCAYIRQERPDLLIFDVMGWSAQNGLTVLDTLADEFGADMPPVIVATALNDRQIAGHPVLQRLPRWQPLYKPFDIFNLLKTVDNLI
ncbi:MAG: response regulator [Ktedonobacterales bacterium]|nr:response regulator [Ktedonobacterales bacterium]